MFYAQSKTHKDIALNSSEVQFFERVIYILLVHMELLCDKKETIY
jgi:hypothetical protein